MAAAESSGGRSMLWLAACGAVGLAPFILRFSGVHVDPVLAACVYGLGILAGAFILSWAAEAAQHDVSASLAIAILALIAILPEYAIEAVLAWDAGQSFDPATGEVTEEMSRVAANVTGSNRLLIGIGWSAVILIFWVRRRRSLDLRGFLSLEMLVLSLATALSFIIFLTNQVHMALAGVLIALYAVYLWRSSREEMAEPDLLGPALVIGNLRPARRRAAVAALLVYSAAVILVAAEPFVESLIETGDGLGIDDFILIQWIAPLASESPEIIVAVLFSLRANPVDGMSTLISAEVNQLTAAHREHGRYIQHLRRRAAELRTRLPAERRVPPHLRHVGLRHPAGTPPADRMEIRSGAPRSIRRTPCVRGRGGASHLRLRLPRPVGGPARTQPAPPEGAAVMGPA